MRARSGTSPLPILTCAAMIAVTMDPSSVRADEGAGDPLAAARASIGKTRNLEANVPPMCYTRTDGTSNPCWTCHTAGSMLNARVDYDLQREYAFSEVALENHWRNLFRDTTVARRAISDEEVIAWVRGDNYRPLREALARRADYRGYRPDLDLAAGFDEEGFARDGSGWRAVRYKPFPGTSWPTSGSLDDVFIRLPLPFRTDERGRPSRAVYMENLALLERAIATAAPSFPVGARYVGGAAAIAITPHLYPAGTELLHSVRYLDPDRPGMMATRMKELRYARKLEAPDPWAIRRAYAREAEERFEGRLPSTQGDPESGYLNPFGWLFQGFIEDAAGRLRLQTEEEHRFCMGCHSSIGVTIDSTFAFPRKLPGAAGWRVQDLRGQCDAPQVGHRDGELRAYLRRVGAVDDLRADDETAARLARVLERGGQKRDLAQLLLPSRRRALELDKAYLVIVRAQSFVEGRDAVLSPMRHVHERIVNGSTELGRAGRVFADGKLHLDWGQIPTCR
jgi:hypothetical protein